MPLVFQPLATSQPACILGQSRFWGRSRDCGVVVEEVSSVFCEGGQLVFAPFLAGSFAAFLWQ